MAADVQGLRKSFLAWGIKFQAAFNGIFSFEIVDHSYKDFINQNKYLQYRGT